MECRQGRYHNCRHHNTSTENKFLCNKHGELHDCHGCRVCPNCNGRLAPYKTVKVIGQGKDYYYHSMTCANCGAYYEHEQTKLRTPSVQDTNGNYNCQVYGCDKKSKDPHQHTDDDRQYNICDHHNNKMEQWRGAGSEKKPPILIKDSVLQENPFYRKRHEGKKENDKRGGVRIRTAGKRVEGSASTSSVGKRKRSPRKRQTIPTATPAGNNPDGGAGIPAGAGNEESSRVNALAGPSETKGKTPRSD